jgi:hypothetical protein
MVRVRGRCSPTGQAMLLSITDCFLVSIRPSVNPRFAGTSTLPCSYLPASPHLRSSFPLPSSIPLVSPASSPDEPPARRPPKMFLPLPTSRPRCIAVHDRQPPRVFSPFLDASRQTGPYCRRHLRPLLDLPYPREPCATALDSCISVVHQEQSRQKQSKLQKTTQSYQGCCGRPGVGAFCRVLRVHVYR